MGQVSTIGVFLRRYRVSILFPTFSIGAIVADYAHTQKYKKSLADFQKKLQKESQ
ncbi:unnamed protein product [Chironomus riparius]|uniref:Uncharacterized protein n=1 Tax=Chironomus riparius TaxID=315576 RepID=A0A9N9RSC3_9DIPT|nr:unnamed protein product [Chironomus riparius]